MKSALERLDHAGHVAYVVGGSVRDFLIERATKDHDIATDASPDEICELFPDAVTVGKAYGVIKVPVKGAEGEHPPMLEIATFREDLEYHDHRHPRGVRFSGPVEDARRRDFTINALFYDPKTSRILDTVGGIDDLKAGVVRAIGNPDERFREDALRLLRAVRFATRLGFSIEPATGEAIQARAKLIGRVSAERIRDELDLMLAGPHPDQAVLLLSKLKLLSQVLPEVEALKGFQQNTMHPEEGDAFAHTVKVLRSLGRESAGRSRPLGWAALLHEAGKPGAARRSAGKNYNGHEVDGAKVAFTIGTRLKMSREEIDAICAMIAEHLKFKDVFQMREATLQRFIREPYFEELLALHKAEALSTDGNLAFHEYCLSRYEAMKKGAQRELPRLIDGKDLIQLGFRPGPEFSEILRVVEDLALEKKLLTKEQALEYVVQTFVK